MRELRNDHCACPFVLASSHAGRLSNAPLLVVVHELCDILRLPEEKRKLVGVDSSWNYIVHIRHRRQRVHCVNMLSRGNTQEVCGDGPTGDIPHVHYGSRHNYAVMMVAQMRGKPIVASVSESSEAGVYREIVMMT
jgi:hypothetical protein